MPNHDEQINATAYLMKCNRLQTILQILQAVNAAEFHPLQTPRLMLEKISSQLGYPFASIFMLDDTKKRVILQAFTGETDARSAQPRYSFESKLKTAVNTCLQKGKSATTNKVTPLPNDPRMPTLSEFHASVVLPLKSEDGTTIGVLEILTPSADTFSTDETEILELLSAQLSVTLQNVQRYSSTYTMLQQLRSIQAITRDTGQEPAMDDLIHRGVRTLSTMLPHARVCFLTPETRGNLRVRAYAGYADAETNTLHLQPGGGAAGLAARQLKPQIISEIAPDDEKKGLSPDSRSILAVPVHYAGSLSGVFNLESVQPSAFCEADLELVSALANNLAPILSNLAFVDQINLQVERQKQLYEITNKIRRSINIDTIMQTSVEEICNALDLPKATIRLKPSALSPDEGSKHEEQPS